ncbi:UNVERIFIED_CONTAM: hypothetical protein RKD50_009687 [Streptomyces canus]
MVKVRQEMETEYRQLRERLLARHGEVVRYDPADEAFDTGYARLLQAADELLV